MRQVGRRARLLVVVGGIIKCRFDGGGGEGWCGARGTGVVKQHKQTEEVPQYSSERKGRGGRRRAAEPTIRVWGIYLHTVQPDQGTMWGSESVRVCDPWWICPRRFVNALIFPWNTNAELAMVWLIRWAGVWYMAPVKVLVIELSLYYRAVCYSIASSKVAFWNNIRCLDSLIKLFFF